MRSPKEMIAALWPVEIAIQNALQELQATFGEEEGDDPQLLDALITIREIIKECADER